MRQTTRFVSAPLFLGIVLLAACERPEDGLKPLVVDGVRFIPMRAERFPDMHHPIGPYPGRGRGLVLAAGGHTTGFIPEKSAEYLKDGKWVEVEMLYPHDAGSGLPLRDGRMLLGGGYGESFGISQSWGAVLWDPASLQFRPFPILDHKPIRIESRNIRASAGGNDQRELSRYGHPRLVDNYPIVFLSNVHSQIMVYTKLLITGLPYNNNIHSEWSITPLTLMFNNAGHHTPA